MIDNYAIWLAHEEENERWLAKRPKCAYCDEPIQEEHFYEIDCEMVCEDCLNLHFRRTVEDE